MKELSAEHYSDLCHKYLEVGDTDKATPILENALTVYPNTLTLRIQYAELAMKLAKYRVAVNRWQVIIDEFESFPEGVYWRQADAYMLDNQFEKSREVISLVVSKYGDSQKVNNYLSLIDSKQASRYNLLIEKNNNDSVFVIDEPLSSLNNLRISDLKNIKLRGWVKSTYSKPAMLLVKNSFGIKFYNLNIDRLEVKNNFFDSCKDVTIQCGFEYEIDLTLPTDIGYYVGGKEYWVITVDKKKVLDVLEGYDDWLFLANDSNRSIEQFTGKLLLNEDNTNEWSEFARQLVSYS